MPLLMLQHQQLDVGSSVDRSYLSAFPCHCYHTLAGKEISFLLWKKCQIRMFFEYFHPQILHADLRDEG